MREVIECRAEGDWYLALLSCGHTKAMIMQREAGSHVDCHDCGRGE